MTTTFKVVEFYRNTLSNGYTSDDSSSIQSGSTKPKGNGTATLTRSESINISNSIVYNTLGFNVIGGYLSEIPVTVVDVLPQPTNATKPIRVSFLDKNIYKKLNIYATCSPLFSKRNFVNLFRLKRAISYWR
jgi:hypothetical protein